MLSTWHWPSSNSSYVVSFLCLIIVNSQGTQAQWVLPSSPWVAPRRTWSMCGLYLTSLAVMQRTFPSRKGRSLSSWRSRRSSGGVPRVKRGVSGWSLCPTWRNWYDLHPTSASLPMDLATQTAMGSRSLLIPLSTPMPSPRHRHLRHCPLAHLELSILYHPCRMAPSWQRPSRNECHALMTKQLSPSRYCNIGLNVIALFDLFLSSCRSTSCWTGSTGSQLCCISQLCTVVNTGLLWHW